MQLDITVILDVEDYTSKVNHQRKNNLFDERFCQDLTTNHAEIVNTAIEKIR